MDRKFFKVQREEVKNMLSNLFKDELQDCKLGKPEVKLLFSTSAMDYVPGIVIEAKSKNCVKFLVYSPLQMNINIFEEEPDSPRVEFAKTYSQGDLNADIIGAIEDPEIVLYKDIDGKSCKTAEKALNLIKAFVAMSQTSLQQDYFKIPGQDITLRNVEGTSYWLMPHRGNYAFLVNKENSSVEYRNIKRKNS